MYCVNLAKLKEKWWNYNSECGTVVGNGPSISYQSELSLSDLSGIFFILVLGLIGMFQLTKSFLIIFYVHNRYI